MTTGDSMSGTGDCCGDGAAYLLGALEPSEEERFRRHLDECVVCRDELAALQPVVDLLPLSAPQHRAPRALRSRVMQDVRSQPFRTSGAAPRRRRERSIRFPRLALAGTVAAVAALAIIGGFELSSVGPSVRVIRASVAGSLGSARLRIAGGHAELIVAHLPPLPPGRIYEVWVKRGPQAPSPTGVLFSVTSSGTADVGVPTNLSGVSLIMVSAEPAGGSLAPTRAPVVVARID
jgi:anti-sigma-K factor RskA